MDKGNQAHFMDQVQRVVACSTVSTDANVYSFFHHFRNGGKAIAKFHIAGRIGNNAYIMLCHNIHIFFINLHAVCGDKGMIEKPGALCKLNRAAAVGLFAVFHFIDALRQMHVYSHILFAGLFCNDL